MRGILATLEGIDGSGKTTALRIISRELIEALGNRKFCLHGRTDFEPGWERFSAECTYRGNKL